ncbi:hypothetical protein AGMMS4956_03120 [Bacteroidia bacterium]|nr:hypothetical protein AGMMS4956_03120 [Bacteroidia bacterium]
MAIAAGKIMLKRTAELLNRNKNFAVETTLAAKNYKKTIGAAKSKKYNVTLLFFWLQTVDLAKKRVQARVNAGGHNIETDVIQRRYVSGIINLFDIYIPIVDTLLIFDNSEGNHQLIAKKKPHNKLQVIDNSKFNNMINQYYEYKR